MALSCFEAAERLGSFTRAAQELRLTQAAVSRQVIGLERRLGVALFERRREALRLTAAGRSLLDEVRPALLRIERVTTSVAALKGQGGRLNLSVASSLGTYWLIPRLPGFTAAHPEITLNIATRVGPADFSTGGIDASLEFGDGQRPGLSALPVLPLTLSPYVSAARHRPWRRLDRDVPSSALIHHSTLPEAWPAWFDAAGLSMPVGEAGPRHDLMSMALHAVLAGLGVALLPEFMTGQGLASGQLVRLSAVAWSARRGYHLVWPAQFGERPALLSFRDWLLAQALNPAAALSGSTSGSNPRRGRTRPPAALHRAP